MTTHKQTFPELIHLIQQGDESAFQLVLAQYGDAMRREVRFTLRDNCLRGCVDESDILQSDAFRYFVGMRDEQYELHTPQDLVGLLKGITRNRVAEIARFWHAQRRDVQRNRSLSAAESQSVIRNASHVLDGIARAELAQTVLTCLSPEDHQILEWRDDRLSWAEIAERLGGTAEAVRKRHERSLSKIANKFKDDGKDDIPTPVLPRS